MGASSELLLGQCPQDSLTQSWELAVEGRERKQFALQVGVSWSVQPTLSG